MCVVTVVYSCVHTDWLLWQAQPRSAHHHLSFRWVLYNIYLTLTIHLWPLRALMAFAYVCPSTMDMLALLCLC